MRNFDLDIPERRVLALGLPPLLAMYQGLLGIHALFSCCKRRQPHASHGVSRPSEPTTHVLIVVVLGLAFAF